jgi:hypothetical protein
MQQRKARVGDLAIQVRAVNGQQHHRCHGYPKPSHPRFLRSGRTLVKVTTSPPMSGSHRIAAAAAFQNEYDLI